MQKSLVYSSTAFKNVKEDALSGAKEESAQKMKRQSTKDEETVGKGAALGRLRVTLIPALSHCLSASP